MRRKICLGSSPSYVVVQAATPYQATSAGVLACCCLFGLGLLQHDPLSVLTASAQPTSTSSQHKCFLTWHHPNLLSPSARQFSEAPLRPDGINAFILRRWRCSSLPFSSSARHYATSWLGARWLKFRQTPSVKLSRKRFKIPRTWSRLFFDRPSRRTCSY